MNPLACAGYTMHSSKEGNVRSMSAGAGRHTLFMYIEDDSGLSWPALKAWARDESLLKPLGLHRGFVRVQPSQWDGKLIANDQLGPVSLGSGNATISIPHTLQQSPKEARVQHTWHKTCASAMCTVAHGSNDLGQHRHAALWAFSRKPVRALCQHADLTLHNVCTGSHLLSVPSELANISKVTGSMVPSIALCT